MCVKIRLAQGVSLDMNQRAESVHACNKKSRSIFACEDFPIFFNFKYNLWPSTLQKGIANLNNKLFAMDYYSIYICVYRAIYENSLELIFFLVIDLKSFELKINTMNKLE